jgi:hypothetical protein
MTPKPVSLFKLLEVLGKQKGHFYDLRERGALEDLSTKTRLSEVYVRSVLTLCVRLGMIDTDLYELKNIIWASYFIDDLVAVYNRRNCGVPEKPVYDDMNPVDQTVDIIPTERGKCIQDSDKDPVERGKCIEAVNKYPAVSPKVGRNEVTNEREEVPPPPVVQAKYIKESRALRRAPGDLHRCIYHRSSGSGPPAHRDRGHHTQVHDHGSSRSREVGSRNGSGFPRAQGPGRHAKRLLAEDAPATPQHHYSLVADLRARKR